MSARILHGDCLPLMREMPDNSFDSAVMDPPAGISFMGAAWDGDKGGRKQWTAWMTEVLTEVLRVVKPGGHALVWALPRTSHWTGWAAEEAGWESRDVLHHCFYTGFPKSHDVSKAIDAMHGAEREVVSAGAYANRRPRPTADTNTPGAEYGFGAGHVITAPATPDAVKWAGFGTAVKPSVEHWHLLRKPLEESTIAKQVLATGTGAINIDGCRFPQGSDMWPGPQENGPSTHASGEWGEGSDGDSQVYGKHDAREQHTTAGQLLGRFPANLVCVSKPSRREKEAGCEGLPARYSPKGVSGGVMGGKARRCPEHGGAIRSGSTVYTCGCAHVFDKAIPQKLSAPRNHHPTPKPVALMRWLCRLVTPPQGVICDPFCGSGTTGVAAKLEGFGFVGCELSKEYVNIARARIKHAAPGQEVEGGTDPEPVAGHQPSLFG